jgi:hypothetical protein
MSQLPDNMSCDTMATHPKFVGETGKKFRVKCPKNCLNSEVKGNIFGSNVYTDDSSVCIASIHSGFAKDEEASEFVVVIQNGLETYASSF